VSPDGSVVAAAVEGQQEVQLLQLQQGAEGEATSLQLLQRLAFEDVANPAAVAFDGQGRLWVVGGLLLLETESAHVGVAAREAAGGCSGCAIACVLFSKVHTMAGFEGWRAERRAKPACSCFRRWQLFSKHRLFVTYAIHVKPCTLLCAVVCRWRVQRCD
jgi:hypothetical protein